MARLHPFRALRPVPDAAARVAAVPYDVVSRDEALGLAAGNPLSFLHVSRAEIDLPPETDSYAADVYATAAASMQRIRHDAPLVVEEDPSLYFYRLRMGAHEQIGLAACFWLDEYERDLIKKHERTRRDKEDDRTRHMVSLRAQTGTVFLTYRASATVDVLAGRTCAGDPLFDFEAPDHVRHTVWRVPGGQVAALIRAFAHVPALYIADGHHRIASAARARAELRSAAMRSAPELASDRVLAEHDTVLGVAFPDNQVQILAYNRIVRDLAGYTPAAFLEELRRHWSVTEGPSVPGRRGEVAMYLAGTWHTIRLVERAESLSADRIAGFDVTRLQTDVLERVLKVGDVRTDKRIDFVGGARGTGELERLVDSRRAAVAFSMYPVAVDDLMAIADAGAVMPPKSTWFEPKLRDGLLSHLI